MSASDGPIKHLREIDLHTSARAEADERYVKALARIFTYVETLAHDGFTHLLLDDHGSNEAGNVSREAIDADSVDSRAAVMEHIHEAILYRRDALYEEHQTNQARANLLTGGSSAEEPHPET